MKKLITLLLSLFFLSSPSISAEVCPEGTWNRNQYSGRDGGLYTGRGGGMYTGRGGGLYTGRGGGLYTGRGEPYCTNRPPLHILIEL